MTPHRPRHPMPKDVEQALRKSGVTDAYEARPAYQQNDYIGWITRAKEEPTRRKRIDQMLFELKKGGVYMGIAHPPSAEH